MLHRLAILAVVLLLGVLAGCSSPDSEAAPQRSTGASPSATTTAAERPSIGRYVALGDSYTAAPGIPGERSDDGCWRSSRNYPRLLAELVNVAELVDVSCGGASTVHLTKPQPVGGERVPPQLRAVTADTELVTLGIGGNDLNLFGRLVGGCVRANAASAPGSPCTDRLGGELSATVAEVEQRVGAAIAAVRAAAPQARVVVVGYPQMVPASGTCPDLPVAPGDYPFARSATEAMARAVERAAGAARVEYVDLLAASEGHDICSDEPWVNGFSGPGAAAFHPFAVEQAYVAEQLAGLLGAPGT